MEDLTEKTLAMNNHLPETPSLLIRVALNDLTMIEKDSRYVIDMGNWHCVRADLDEPICEVCLAGATMAKTLDTPDTIVDIDLPDILDFGGPSSPVTRKLFEKLSALDAFRCGYVHKGLRHLSIYDFRGVNEYWTVWDHNRKNPEPFYFSLRALANTLERCGL